MAHKDIKIALGIVGVTTAAYLTYLYIKNKKAKQAENVTVDGVATVISSKTGGGSGTKVTYNGSVGFPIKKGSSGELVKLLQQALINQGAKLPKYGADGKFGVETEAALNSLYGMTIVADNNAMQFILGNSKGTGAPQILSDWGKIKNASLGLL